VSIFQSQVPQMRIYGDQLSRLFLQACFLVAQPTGSKHWNVIVWNVHRWNKCASQLLLTETCIQWSQCLCSHNISTKVVTLNCNQCKTVTYALTSVGISPSLPILYFCREPYLTYGSLGPTESAAKWHLDWFSHFCRGYSCCPAHTCRWTHTVYNSVISNRMHLCYSWGLKIKNASYNTWNEQKTILRWQQFM